MIFGKFNQQATQPDAMKVRIVEGKDIVVSGEEALKEAKLIDAIYKSTSLNWKTVEL